uniref:Uncharacterized protein n=1 Tax=Oryza brachyantha TaxID=4533 RepID=J3N9J9_ORYBR
MRPIHMIHHRSPVKECLKKQNFVIPLKEHRSGRARLPQLNLGSSFSFPNVYKLKF